jgi:hypothetical protein
VGSAFPVVSIASTRKMCGLTAKFMKVARETVAGVRYVE